MSGRNEKRVLAVLDEDQNYAWRLAEFMNEKSGFPFEACPFTEPERLIAYLEDHVVGAVLADETLLNRYKDQLIRPGLLCVAFTQEMTDGAEAGASFPCVFKYQPARKIIEQVMACAAQDKGLLRSTTPSDQVTSDDPEDERTLEGERMNKTLRERPAGSMPPGSRLLGIYSPIGRCGKTAFALALGEVLAENERTLYLDLDRYSGMRELGVMEEGAGDLNDLLYYHRIDPESLVFRIGSVVHTFRNLDYIPSPLQGEDVMAVRAAEWLDLFAALASAGEYSALVLDLGIALEEALPVLNACACIYMPVLEDQVSAAKISQFTQAVQQMGLGHILSKITRLLLPAIREESWGRDVSARFARGKMGAYVRKLL